MVIFLTIVLFLISRRLPERVLPNCFDICKLNQILYIVVHVAICISLPTLYCLQRVFFVGAIEVASLRLSNMATLKTLTWHSLSINWKTTRCCTKHVWSSCTANGANGISVSPQSKGNDTQCNFVWGTSYMMRLPVGAAQLCKVYWNV